LIVGRTNIEVTLKGQDLIMVGRQLLILRHKMSVGPKFFMCGSGLRPS